MRVGVKRHKRPSAGGGKHHAPKGKVLLDNSPAQRPQPTITLAPVKALDEPFTDFCVRHGLVKNYKP